MVQNDVIGPKLVSSGRRISVTGGGGGPFGSVAPGVHKPPAQRGG